MQSAARMVGWPEPEPDGDEEGPGAGFAPDASLPPSPQSAPPVDTAPAALVQQLVAIATQLQAAMPPAPADDSPIPIPPGAPMGAEMM